MKNNWAIVYYTFVNCKIGMICMGSHGKREEILGPMLGHVSLAHELVHEQFCLSLNNRTLLFLLNFKLLAVA